MNYLADLQTVFATIGLGAVTISTSAILFFAIDSMICRARRKRDLLNRPRWIHRV